MILWVAFAVIAVFVVVGGFRVRAALKKEERTADQPDPHGEHRKKKHGARPE
jgi:hypothetical protein